VLLLVEDVAFDQAHGPARPNYPRFRPKLPLPDRPQKVDLQFDRGEGLALCEGAEVATPMAASATFTLSTSVGILTHPGDRIVKVKLTLRFLPPVAGGRGQSFFGLAGLDRPLLMHTNSRCPRAAPFTGILAVVVAVNHPMSWQTPGRD
jgi:hypothetical protein